METNNNSIDPIVLHQQQNHLAGIAVERWGELFRLFNAIDTAALTDFYHWPPSLSAFHKKLYDLGIIFDFPWMDWEEGRKKFNDPAFDYNSCSLLEASMLLTAICRSERFSEGTIIWAFQLKKMPALISCMREKVGVGNPGLYQ